MNWQHLAVLGATLALAACTRAGFERGDGSLPRDAAPSHEQAVTPQPDTGSDLSVAPVLPLALHFGGTTSELLIALHIATDGDILLAGAATSDITVEGQTTPLAGNRASFLLHIDSASGTITPTYYEATDRIEVSGVARDLDGHVFAAGYMRGAAQFGGAVGSYDAADHQEAFVLYLDGATRQPLWFRSYGGISNYQIHDAELSGANAIAVSGFYSNNALSRFGLLSLPDNNDIDQPFLLRVDSAGRELSIYRLDTSDNSNSLAMATRASGGHCLAGWFTGTADFDGDQSADATANGVDAFVVGLAPDGTPQWFRSFSAAGAQQINAATGAGDDCVVAGSFVNRVDLGSNLALGGGGGDDAVLIRLAANTGATLWGHAISTPGDDLITEVAVANDGRVFAVGRFSGQTLPGAPDMPQPANADGVDDAFLLVVASDGSYLSFDQAGGSGSDGASVLALDPRDASVVWGGVYDAAFSFEGASFPAPKGGDDAWLLRVAR